jgi:hypothetical protein
MTKNNLWCMLSQHHQYRHQQMKEFLSIPAKAKAKSNRRKIVMSAIAGV